MPEQTSPLFRPLPATLSLFGDTVSLKNVSLFVADDARDNNGGVVVRLMQRDGEFFELWATLSVNIPASAHLLEDREFFLKDWSENAELVREMLAAGMIEIVPGKSARTGLVSARVARLRV